MSGFSPHGSISHQITNSTMDEMNLLNKRKIQENAKRNQNCTNIYHHDIYKIPRTDESAKNSDE